MKSLLLVLVSLFVFGDPGSDARTWRSLTASRPRDAADSLHVVLRYDAGTVTLGAAAAPLLYQASARFDASEQRISRSYNPVSGTLRIGLDDLGQHFLHLLRDETDLPALTETHPRNVSFPIEGDASEVEDGI